MGRKNKTSKAPVAPSAEATDACHSLSTPSCDLVSDVSADIIPESSQSSAVPSHFGAMARQHLLLQLKHPPNRSNSNPSNKKKRKKRKKKGSKGTDSISECSSITDQSTTSSLSDSCSGSTLHLESPESSPVSFKPLCQPGQLVEEESSASVVVASSISSLSVRTQESQCQEVVVQWMEKLEPVQEETRTDRTLVDFCDELVSKQVKPSILVSDISQALSCATCIPCRAAADIYWHATGIPVHELGDIKAEGHHTECIVLEPNMIEVPHQSSSGLTFEGIDKDGAGAFFVEDGTLATDATTEARREAQIITFEPVPGKDGAIESLRVSSALDATAVERMLRQIILPCGLSEVAKENAFVLSDSQFDLIAGHISKLEPVFYEELQKLGADREQIQRTFDAAVHKNADFDLTASKVLSNCDQQIDKLFGQLFQTLMQMTTMTDCLPDAEWAHNITERLWTNCERAMKSNIEMQIKHDQRQLQAANRMGCVPQTFLHADLRRSYRDLVSEKLRVLTGLYTELSSELTGGDQTPDDGPTLVRKVVTFHKFIDVTLGNKTSSLKKTELDVSVEHLTEAFAGLTFTTSCSQVSDIQLARLQRCKSILETLRTCNGAVDQEYKQMNNEEKNEVNFVGLRKNYAELVAIAEHSLQQETPIEEETEDMRKLFADLVSNMTATWRCLRAMRSQQVSAPIMPLRLQKWMKITKIDARGHSVCNGGGGKRRFASVLASLLYRCLSERCDRWYAEMNEAELLESMGLESVTSVCSEETKKSRKKSNKHKHQKSATVDDTQREIEQPIESLVETDEPVKEAPFVPQPTIEANDSSTHSPTSVRNKIDPLLCLGVEKSVAGVEETKEEYDPSVEEIKEEYEPAVETPVQARTFFAEKISEEYIAAAVKKTRKQVVEEEDAMEEKKEERFELSNHFTEESQAQLASAPVVEKHLEPSMGVEDDHGQYETAQDFLSARLTVLLQQGTADASGNPIVRISY